MRVLKPKIAIIALLTFSLHSNIPQLQHAHASNLSFNKNQNNKSRYFHRHKNMLFYKLWFTATSLYGLSSLYFAHSGLNHFLSKQALDLRNKPINSLSFKNNTPEIWVEGCITDLYHTIGWNCKNLNDYCYGSPGMTCFDVQEHLTQTLGTHEPPQCTCPTNKDQKKLLNKFNKSNPNEILNIIFVHRAKDNNKHYFCDILKNIKSHSNSDTTNIFWIGDDFSSCHLKNVINVPLRQLFDQRIERFKFNYRNKHFSPNNVEYESFCFIRWMLIANLIDQWHINQNILVLDSDTLLLDPIEKIIEPLKDFEIATTLVKSSQRIKAVLPHFTFFKNKQLLSEFNQYIENFYSVDKENLTPFFQRVATTSNGHLVISDMIIFGVFLNQKFSFTNSDKYFDFNPKNNENITHHIIPNLNTIEHDISILDSDISSNFSENNSSHHITYSAIHFQGISKQYIKFILKCLHNTESQCHCSAPMPLNNNTLTCSNESGTFLLANENEDPQSHLSSYSDNPDGYVPVNNPEHRFQDQLDPKYEFIQHKNLTNSNGLIAKGGYGIVYLVRDIHTQELFVAKFLRKDKFKKAKKIMAYEGKLINQWQEIFDNPLEYTKNNDVSYRNFISGDTLNKWMSSGRLFEDTEIAAHVREKLIEFFQSILHKKVYIYDMNSENIIFNFERDRWVLIDGDSVVYLNSFQEAMDLFKSTNLGLMKYRIKNQKDLFKKIEVFFEQLTSSIEYNYNPEN